MVKSKIYEVTNSDTNSWKPSCVKKRRGWVFEFLLKREGSKFSRKKGNHFIGGWVSFSYSTTFWLLVYFCWGGGGGGSWVEVSFNPCFSNSSALFWTPKRKFFATIVNNWKWLSNNYCLKESDLRYGRVLKSAFGNWITAASLLP